MELIPWSPFGREVSTLRKEMDDLFGRFFGDFPLTRRMQEEWAPRVDISETKDSYVVKAELPGLEAKDVNVSVSGDVLTVKGEKKKEEIQVKVNIDDHDPSPGLHARVHKYDNVLESFPALFYERVQEAVR
jgi:HSP20 family protein